MRRTGTPSSSPRRSSRRGRRSIADKGEQRRRLAVASTGCTAAPYSGRGAEEVGDPRRGTREGPRITSALADRPTAQSGISPVIERARTGQRLAVGGAAYAVVVEAVGLVPEPAIIDGLGDQREVLEELDRDVLVGRVVAWPARSRSRACSGSRGPSSPCRRPARGSGPPGAATSGRTAPTLSMPRKPPPKRLSPSGSLTLAHQVKPSSILWKIRSSHSRSRRPSSS